MKAISHLSTLRNKNRRERLEWLGDTVMEEAVVRLVAREAMAALEREREEDTAAAGGSGEEEVPPGLTGSTLSWRLDSAIRLVVSNANLGAVYGAQLVGLMGFLGLEEDHLGVPGGKRCRSSCSSSPSSSFVGLLPPSLISRTASERKADKRLPDLVESAIGEAFEASLALGLRAGPGSSGSQRFAGRHRAALVDRLLSSALCTEFVLANLDLGGGGGGGGGFRAEGGGSAANFANSFGALDTDDDDDDDDDDRGNDGEKGGEVEGNGGTGGGSRSFDPPGDADADADVHADAQRWAEAAGERVQATGDGGDAAADKERARRDDSGDGGNGGGSSSSGGGNRGGGDGRSSSSSSACRGAKSFASGMEAVFRLYGAALIKFRVSVFLYCSASAAAPVRVAGGGGDDEQGPSELTMRRQRVVCAENLEAVAAHLRPAGEGGRAPDAPVLPEASPARQWLRVAVGRAALCEGGDTSFSTRVAALLLSRSGERGGPPRNGGNAWLSSGATKAEEASTRGGGKERAKPTREETEALAAAAAVEAAAVAAATAEEQFRRDPWPERDLPRASEKAALMFRDRNRKADMGPNCAPPAARLGRGDDPGAVDARERPGDVFRGDASVDSRDLPWGPCTSSTAPPSPPCAGKKRKRAPQGRTSCAAGEPCLPPYYVGLIGGLPRDSRHLLARLGHQGYVKVLEELLNRFLYGPNALAIDAQPGAAATVTVAAVTAAAVSTQGAPARRATPSAHLRVPHVKAGKVAAEAATRSAAKAPTVDTEVAAFVEADEGTVCLQPPLDEAPNPWRAVQTGKPHPSLSGLVEPPELARTGPRRMVLPIPNPFYRRVLHALCRVHGLCSHGGETSGDRGGAGPGRGKAAVRHRTVEITRVAVGGSSRGRRPGRAERQAGAAALIPVETLLGGR